MLTKRDDVKFSVDGDMICATRPTFVNLQESPAGFGATEEDALANLEHEESCEEHDHGCAYCRDKRPC